MKPSDTTMTCFRCKCEIRVRPNARYCDTCRPIVKAEQSQHSSLRIEDNRRERLAARAKIEKHAATRHKSAITDAEQKALNLAIDNKHACPTVTKIYKPGSAEFKRIAAQIMPISRVRRACSDTTTYVDAEPQGSPRIRRPEMVNAL